MNVTINPNILHQLEVVADYTHRELQSLVEEAIMLYLATVPIPSPEASDDKDDEEWETMVLSEWADAFSSDGTVDFQTLHARTTPIAFEELNPHDDEPT